ncbi:hypothetical protein R3P38DRAFT_723878 [Favolaschia claudopus]|uniref:Uncharacterized protein n=1 Tax=Favolaschia claudopus TaxID=2862362 RepID=A0AAV9Z442_9AGAR
MQRCSQMPKRSAFRAGGAGVDYCARARVCRSSAALPSVSDSRGRDSLMWMDWSWEDANQVRDRGRTCVVPYAASWRRRASVGIGIVGLRCIPLPLLYTGHLLFIIGIAIAVEAFMSSLFPRYLCTPTACSHSRSSTAWVCHTSRRGWLGDDEELDACRVMNARVHLFRGTSGEKWMVATRLLSPWYQWRVVIQFGQQELDGWCTARVRNHESRRRQREAEVGWCRAYV